MHIAVCDDNTADRHQMERLLKRESDRIRETHGNLYTDAFGNCDALLSNPMQYDVFFIDVCKTEGITGTDVVNRLTAAGVNAPIVLCCSAINYREAPLPVNVFFLDKPIRAEELHQCIEQAGKLMAQTETLIELRLDRDTLYVSERDILYAVEKKRCMEITLADSRTVVSGITADNFFSQVEPFESFVDATRKIVLNCRHISSLNKNRAAMSDGAVFKIDRVCLSYAKKMFEKYSRD